MYSIEKINKAIQDLCGDQDHAGEEVAVMVPLKTSSNGYFSTVGIHLDNAKAKFVEPGADIRSILGDFPYTAAVRITGTVPNKESKGE